MLLRGLRHSLRLLRRTPGFSAVAVLVLGALFVTRALALMRDPTPQRAIRFFAWSNVYLMLVFVAVAVDALLS